MKKRFARLNWDTHDLCNWERTDCAEQVRSETPVKRVPTQSSLARRWFVTWKIDHLLSPRATCLYVYSCTRISSTIDFARLSISSALCGTLLPVRVRPSETTKLPAFCPYYPLLSQIYSICCSFTITSTPNHNYKSRILQKLISVRNL